MVETGQDAMRGGGEGPVWEYGTEANGLVDPMDHRRETILDGGILWGVPGIHVLALVRGPAGRHCTHPSLPPEISIAST